MTRTNLDRFATLLTAYADNDGDGSPDDFIIPEDLSSLTDEELTALHEAAVGHFDALYGDGQSLEPDDVAALAQLTEGIETILAAVNERQTAAAERTAQAAELAARVRPELVADPEDEDEDDDDAETSDEDDAEPSGVATITPQAVEGEVITQVAAAATAQTPARRGAIRVNLPSRARGMAPRPAAEARTMQDVMLAADVPGFRAGEGLDWDGVGRAVDRRLTGFNMTQYANAAKAGRHMREQHSVAVIRKPFDQRLVVGSDSPEAVDRALQYAMSEARLPGGSLVAAGGWCAPSETIYDLCEMESRDGLFSLPEINIARGGISWTLGPNFATIFAEADFTYTEAEDIAGDYDGEGGGVKPCFRVDCPAFTEARLGIAGLCITAGLLQQRGYPEVIARTVRGALIAHDHKMAARLINAVIAGSTAVTMPGPQAGALAPVLSSIELQVEHFRYSTRASRGTTLEAVFPFWVRGAIRADLARRQGMNLIDVTDAQITAWFNTRGVNAQFIYNWQDINGVAAGAFNAWPATVTFLLYAAGTWVRGSSDIITLDTIYDSVLLGTNDYTALFTEEGWLTAKMCHDSRVVTVPICPDGSTAAGVDIACNGTVA